MIVVRRAAAGAGRGGGCGGAVAAGGGGGGGGCAVAVRVMIMAVIVVVVVVVVMIVVVTAALGRLGVGRAVWVERGLRYTRWAVPVILVRLARSGGLRGRGRGGGRLGGHQGRLAQQNVSERLELHLDRVRWKTKEMCRGKQERNRLQLGQRAGFYTCESQAQTGFPFLLESCFFFSTLIGQLPVRHVSLYGNDKLHHVRQLRCQDAS